MGSFGVVTYMCAKHQGLGMVVALLLLVPPVPCPFEHEVLAVAGPVQ